MYASVMVNYHLARLAVNTVMLQGIQTAQDVSAVQLKHVHQGSESTPRVSLPPQTDVHCVQYQLPVPSADSVPMSSSHLPSNMSQSESQSLPVCSRCRALSRSQIDNICICLLRGFPPQGSAPFTFNRSARSYSRGDSGSRRRAWHTTRPRTRIVPQRNAQTS